MLLSAPFLIAASLTGTALGFPRPEALPAATSTRTETDTITVTRTSFVLHSTPAESAADHTWYSSWLSVTFWTTTTTTCYPVVVTATPTPS